MKIVGKLFGISKGKSKEEVDYEIEKSKEVMRRYDPTFSLEMARMLLVS